jgi:hypothetical protein
VARAALRPGWLLLLLLLPAGALLVQARELGGLEQRHDSGLLARLRVGRSQRALHLRRGAMAGGDQSSTAGGRRSIAAPFRARTP